MPDHPTDPALERLLAYPAGEEGDAFVLSVMQRVRRERSRRRLILGAFGLVGALFGLLGAWLLAEPIRLLFGGLQPALVMQAVLLVVAIAAFYTWCMSDELTVSN